MWKIATSLLAITGCALPGICQAQASPQATASYRFYVDGQLASYKYIVDYPSGANVTGVSPWSLSAGYSLLPRFAVQVGIMHMHDIFVGGGAGTTITHQPSTDVRTYQNWNTAVPLLARFTLIRTSDRRFKVDALAGGTYFFARARFEEVKTIAGQITEYRLDDVQKGGLFLTAGFGGRFIFSRRWEVVGDWTYSRNTANISKQSYWQAGVPNGRTRGLSLGARYCFNLKRKVPAPLVP